MSTDYTQNIRYMLRKGTSDDPYVAITEDIVIKNNKAQLKEVPDNYYKVTIPNYYEVFKPSYDSTFILNSNEFWVDYNIGIIYFNESEEGKTISNVNYKGTGSILYPSDRIFLQHGNPNVIETLQEFIETMLQNTSDFHAILQEFVLKGEYDNNINYKPYNIVTYKNSTYINKVACVDIIPTDTDYWMAIALGYGNQENYDNDKQYEVRDVVYYDIEKTIYICIKRTQGNLPTNMTYWYPMISVKNESLYAIQQGDYAKEQGNYAKTEGDYAKLEGDYAKTQGDYALSQGNDALDVTTNARTAMANYQDIVEKTKKIYKQSVNTYADILTTYPTPEIGWVVQTKDTHIEYRWDGVEWVDIGITDQFEGYNVYISPIPPDNKNLLWVKTEESSSRMARILPSKTEPIDKNVIWWKID